jgi:hypothetical protein
VQLPSRSDPATRVTVSAASPTKSVDDSTGNSVTGNPPNIANPAFSRRALDDDRPLKQTQARNSGAKVPTTDWLRQACQTVRPRFRSR